MALPDQRRDRARAGERQSQTVIGEENRGSSGGAHALLSARCRKRMSPNAFSTLTSAAEKTYGSALPIKSFDAQGSGDLARVTYTYDLKAINQNAEPWVRENGKWKEDDC
jgi:hypothetical protein